MGRLSGTDALIDGKPVQAWAFEAEAGDIVTIDLMSDDFDSYLYVVGPGLVGRLEDDDGGEGLNSRLDVTFPSDGTYRVVASSLGEPSGRLRYACADSSRFGYGAIGVSLTVGYSMPSCSR